ncbi:MAG: Gfo/Idh/MocA family oxidoreductase [Methylobacteriaceae bacterium]|nr:Gfo/Idh/MocA family oxidoreductase [Methylobacteriaceae bacterium]
MRVLVLGLGSIGARHARNFRALGVAEVSGFDPEAERRERHARETGGPAFASLDEALDRRPDLVVVASPNRFHLPQAFAAAERGAALFIEKPIGTDLAEAERLAALIAARGLYCHCGSNWKFHPAFTTMRDWLAEGAIGAMTAIQALAGQWLPDWHPWEDYRRGYSARADLGGGAVFDTHELDYILWLAGPAAEFAGMIARTGALPIETEDNAAALLRMKNGALVTLHTDYIQRQGQRRYLIAGDRGTIEWTTRDGQVRLFTSKGENDRTVDARLADVNDMYVAQSRRVLADLRSGGAPETPVDQMLRVLELQLRWRGER